MIEKNPSRLWGGRKGRNETHASGWEGVPPPPDWQDRKLGLGPCRRQAKRVLGLFRGR